MLLNYAYCYIACYYVKIEKIELKSCSLSDKITHEYLMCNRAYNWHYKNYY